MLLQTQNITNTYQACFLAFSWECLIATKKLHTIKFMISNKKIVAAAVVSALLLFIVATQTFEIKATSPLPADAVVIMNEQIQHCRNAWERQGARTSDLKNMCDKPIRERYEQYYSRDQIGQSDLIP